MLKFTDFGENANEDLYKNIASIMVWSASPDKSVTPEDTAVTTNNQLTENAKVISNNLTNAYKKCVRGSDKANTENAVFIRLQQLHDEAKLISAMYIATMNRDQLMGLL